MNTKTPSLLLDSNRGIYIPQTFAREFDILLPKNIAQDLLDGPENECYWESWQWVLDNVTFLEQGTRYSLYQDGALWAIPLGFNIDAWAED